MYKAEYMKEVEKMYDELTDWRKKNPEASFDEIAEKVGQKRRLINSKLLKELAEQEGVGEYLADKKCPKCEEGTMHYKGEKKKCRS